MCFGIRRFIHILDTEKTVDCFLHQDESLQYLPITAGADPPIDLHRKKMFPTLSRELDY
ncbi:hypothetical protein EmuJ_000474900 [Echinococcus multilocularis]|uniref:Uncharacterized protein n=1 Tax=Echinococcus multilocularis TaxID=6211 RepID=A0A068Y5R9_ECHMU|nr:hypothetical protein EmuJ_000474900 [Echinococcus multilocularis]